MKEKEVASSSILHPNFWEGEPLEASSALIDKCDVNIGGWSFSENRQRVSQLIPRISEITIPANCSETCRFFERRTAEEASPVHRLTVTGSGPGEGVGYPHPTFAGWLIVREQRAQPSSRSITRNWEGLFTVNLNLNRSLQAQRLQKLGEGGDSYTTAQAPYALAISRNAATEVIERKLTPDDNIIARDSERTEFVRSKPIERHLADYIQAIFRRVNMELPTHRRRNGVFLTSQMDQTHNASPAPTVTLQHLEVCWDCFDDQPLLSVLQIKNKIQGKRSLDPTYRFVC